MKENYKYDVAIIGAGPAGIYASTRLAERGLRVVVVEEDKQIGKPRFCTGLISKEAFDKFILPREAIEGEFSSAWVLSPLGSKLCLKSKVIQIYVTNRTKFDHGLYKLARDAGVEFMLNCHCAELKINDDGVQSRVAIDGSSVNLKSKVAILSTGIKYNLHRSLGFSPPTNFLDCSQIQVSGKSEGNIEVFLGNSIAPHSFAWVVPLKGDKLRVGISTRKNSPSFLKSFLNYLQLKGYINDKGFDIMRRPIPLEPIKKSFSSRILVVGDAAGQVKPTTGGGIYFGLLCADLAAKTIIQAFKKSDFSEKFLRRYEINWKKQIEFDLTMSIYLRKLLANFNDQQLEELVKFLAQERVQQLIEKHADFNHQGKFIKELIKLPPFWKTFYHMLASK